MGAVGRETAMQKVTMARARVLIVEDDADINQIVATHLSRLGYSCAQAFSGSEALLLMGEGPFPFDVVVSDLMLPGLDGGGLVAEIRARDEEVPVVMISARTDAADRIDLLRLGADDYLTKPFDLEELAVRIEVQLRHRGRGRAAGDAEGGGAGIVRFRSWELDPAARSFRAAGTPVELTRIEFNILLALAEQPQRVFSKQELFERAWGEPYSVDDNTVNVHVSNIRSKLRASGTERYIKTVWGMGFKLAVE